MALITLDTGRPTIIDPPWLREPYSAPDRCYGCGLEPEVMSPHEWVLCHWCNDLRIILRQRAAWPGLML